MKFDYAINLAVTWVNRLLFLKLLEGQLINFNESNTKYEFVNSRVIYDFNKLNELFFGVLAKPVYDRGKLTEIYKNVPYLNSSLFEKSVAESTLSISPAQLDDDVLIGIYTKSVLKKRLAKNTNKLPTLEYLLLFLNSYTFDTDASKVNGENLINSSVLGLIFEKINGYKDGSYYTPGFVTSFMSRNAINKAIVAKFSEHGWKVQSILDIQKSITKENSEDALSILKDFKLVDPAVGSGHFLVSSLNYLVFLRYYFNLMTNTFSLHFNMEIVNDELDIFDGEGNGFTYNRGVDNSLKIQKELFSTKLDIIENNLFGVDINQNSVDITRLRLWIELLKNSYYEDGQLVTMPNLEMNIKVGNSVVSRYELRESLSKMTQNTNLSVSEFKSIVQRYRNTHDKGEKRSLEHIIHKFVQQIRSILTQRQSRNRNKNFQQLNELKKSVSLLDTPIDRKAKRREIKSLTKKINEQKKFYDNADSSLFLNSFEWRFEFPEVLDEQGKFKGFDLVIANPPYIGMQDHAKIFHEVDATQLGKRFSSGKNDFFLLFYALSNRSFKRSRNFRVYNDQLLGDCNLC
nr:hypothetical protein [Secundilactobacillus similis]